LFIYFTSVLASVSAGTEMQYNKQTSAYQAKWFCVKLRSRLTRPLFQSCL